MYEQAIQTLALIGIVAIFYVAIEIFNAIYNKVLLIQDYLEWKRTVRKEKARIYKLNAYRRGA
jgi:hypothetical protein